MLPAGFVGLAGSGQPRSGGALRGVPWSPAARAHSEADAEARRVAREMLSPSPPRGGQCGLRLRACALVVVQSPS